MGSKISVGAVTRDGRDWGLFARVVEGLEECGDVVVVDLSVVVEIRGLCLGAVVAQQQTRVEVVEVAVLVDVGFVECLDGDFLVRGDVVEGCGVAVGPVDAEFVDGGVFCHSNVGGDFRLAEVGRVVVCCVELGLAADDCGDLCAVSVWSEAWVV